MIKKIVFESLGNSQEDFNDGAYFSKVASIQCTNCYFNSFITEVLIICSANQWNGFYSRGTSAMKNLIWANFITDSFWNVLGKLSVLKRVLRKKVFAVKKEKFFEKFLFSSCRSRDIFKNILFYRTPLVAASLSCSSKKDFWVVLLYQFAFVISN